MSEARRLPTGVHGIPAHVVTRNQRERLVAAAAEACAESGYAETSVADLARRAGISTATFYRIFAGKRECLLEAHRDLLERLLEEVDRACAEADGWEERVRAGAHTTLELLAADPPTARLLTVEAMALGAEGAARYDGAIESFGARLRIGRGESGNPSSPTVDWVLLSGISTLLGKRVTAGEAASIVELEDELVAMLVSPG